MEENKLKEILHLDNNYIVENIIADTFLAIINNSDPLHNKTELTSTDFISHTYINISSLEMFTTQKLLLSGFNAKQTFFLESHHSICQAINSTTNSTTNYYSLLSSIFAKTKDYEIYKNLSFHHISDLKYQSAFYLIYSRAEQTRISKYIRQYIIDYCHKIKT